MNLKQSSSNQKMRAKQQAVAKRSIAGLLSSRRSQLKIAYIERAEGSSNPSSLSVYHHNPELNPQWPCIKQDTGLAIGK